MTRDELVTRVGLKLGLAYDVSGDERDLLRAWVNEAIVDILLRTHIYIAIGDVTLTSGTAEYRLDASVLAIDDGRGSTPAGIGHYNVIGLGEMIDRQSTNVVSSGYRKYIAIEGDLLIVSPTPGASETLRFFYVPQPTVTSSGSHDPSNATYGGIPTWAHRSIEYYMLWQGAEYDDKSAALTPKDYHDLYLAECDEIGKRRRRHRDRAMIPPRIGYPGSRRNQLTPNSQYPR